MKKVSVEVNGKKITKEIQDHTILSVFIIMCVTYTFHQHYSFFLVKNHLINKATKTYPMDV